MCVSKIEREREFERERERERERETETGRERFLQSNLDGKNKKVILD